MPYTPGLGAIVTRPAGVALPGAAGSVDLFVVAGGACLITQLVGIVTVGFGVGPGNGQFDHDVIPDALCAILAVGGAALDTRFIITGDPATAMIAVDPAALNVSVIGLHGGPVVAGAGVITNGLFVLPGNIRFTVDADLTPGEVSATLWYIPLEPGANIIAA